MVKLNSDFWRKLKGDKVAFSAMPQKLFKLLMKLLDQYEGKSSKGNPGSVSANPGDDDDVDELMIWLARAEPPIPPTG